MSVTVRFAPSPTGRLHIGNIRTAILNWLFARKEGGRFLLRFDDTDLQRSKEEYVVAIREDLRWLGLSWDEEVRQSDRTARYDAVAEQLKAAGRLYPCYETADELDRKRARQLARGLPPIYDRTGLKLSDEDRQKLESEGRVAHWRFRLANTEGADSLTPLPTLINWIDVIRGEQTVDVGSLSDPVMIRADGSYLYTFTSVIDDIDLGISHIIRGEDHVTNSGVQIELFNALGATPPQLGHHSLLVAADGQALSKRLGALSIASLREDGLEPMAVVSHAALIGTSDPVEPHTDVAELVELFSPSKISTAPARFDPAELATLNAKLLHELPFSMVADRLKGLRIETDEAFWNAVRGNLEKFDDVKEWWSVVAGTVTPVIEDAAFATRAAELLPPEPWGENTWSEWTKAVKEATGAKGKSLFHPLRLALTGREAGPELKVLLPLIGRPRALARLQGQAA
ncbi:glutamyl-tRNA synthetase [Filomicrobium insigne]|uniref:Glutamate--tRNA ligase n=1 Tax=Filomicrobium insigne TaxID=418854 RepID=A0A1H0QZA4_9HYPH|nr:glutamate--tRNA ligase [Filomicrobium insigne]SDP22435.1 glutamyl-tRNA synthetase [Filomicrobium insigne]